MGSIKSELRAVLIGAVAIITASLAASQLPQPQNVQRKSAPSGEVERLRQHFRVVEAELLARDVSHLTATQQAARAKQIEVLRAYSEAGTFPHNHVLTGSKPFFRDEHGTLSALAYLIAESGATELVERVARSHNNAYIHDLADDPELRAWLERNGLTVDEAARIQPSYNWDPAVEKRSSSADATRL